MADLMRAALRMDEIAYSGFLRRAADLVRGAVARHLRAAWPSGVEDVAQETLQALHLKPQTCRTEGAILPALFAIARDKAIGACRRRGSRIEMPVEDFAEVLAGPDTAAAADDTQHIEVAVSTLTGGLQRVVRATALEDRSIKNTAAALDMMTGTVRVVFHRGLGPIAQRFGRSP